LSKSLLAFALSTDGGVIVNVSSSVLKNGFEVLINNLPLVGNCLLGFSYLKSTRHVLVYLLLLYSLNHKEYITEVAPLLSL